MLEVRQLDGARRIEGRLVPWAEQAMTRRGPERIVRGAFSLDASPVLNIAHSQYRPVGRVDGDKLKLEDRESGLFLQGELSNAPSAVDAFALINDGTLASLSVEMLVTEAEMVDGVREIRAAELRGIGLLPAGHAAYKGTWIETRDLHAVRVALRNKRFYL